MKMNQLLNFHGNEITFCLCEKKVSSSKRKNKEVKIYRLDDERIARKILEIFFVVIKRICSLNWVFMEIMNAEGLVENILKSNEFSKTRIKVFKFYNPRESPTSFFLFQRQKRSANIR